LRKFAVNVIEVCPFSPSISNSCLESFSDRDPFAMCEILSGFILVAFGEKAVINVNLANLDRFPPD